MSERVDVPPVSRLHLDALSDDTGILQHALGSRGDPQHGYCTDDVARALEVDLLHARQLGWTAVRHRAHTNLSFIEDAFVPATGEFRNFRRVDRSWVDERPSQDSQGRALHALGSVVAECPDNEAVTTARALIDRALPGLAHLTSPRAVASTLLGLDEAMRGGMFMAVSGPYRRLARLLWASFEGLDGRWFWPERTLTYENGLLARALIVAGQRTRRDDMTLTGLLALDWLLACQTAHDGHLSPIGNGWWTRGGTPSRFDQQPIEATALLRAAGSALAVTGLERYRTAMEMAFSWFLGGNDLGIPVADPVRGAGYDGLTPYGRNENQGAESTLMWLIAVEEIRARRDQPRAWQRANSVRQAVLVA